MSLGWFLAINESFKGHKMTEFIKIPKWYWVAAVAGLLWNLLGVSAFVMQMLISPDMLENMAEAERMALEANPTWFTVAYGTSVIAGALGCSFMMLRNKLATPLFIISFISVLVQMYYSFFMSEHITDYGPGAMSMPIMIIIIGIFLIWFARSSRAKGWIS